MATRYTGPLYHWSPRDRRESIEQNGLATGQRSNRGALYNLDGSEWHCPWLCFGISPRFAWGWLLPEPGTYDLWEVIRDPTDIVRHRRDGGSAIIEVRIHNSIPRDRIIWIGERNL